jgi:hypothetical protein
VGGVRHPLHTQTGPHLQGVAHGMVEPKLLSAVSNTLKIGTESVPETSENFRSLARPSAGEHLMKFCHRESPKTENTLKYSFQNIKTLQTRNTVTYVFVYQPIISTTRQ